MVFKNATLSVPLLYRRTLISALFISTENISFQNKIFLEKLMSDFAGLSKNIIVLYSEQPTVKPVLELKPLHSVRNYSLVHFVK